MKIKLIFDDWRFQGKSIYNTEVGLDLSSGDFHSGSTFKGEIELEPDQFDEFKTALEKGYQPAFWVMI
jgi:hypothetical protein